MTTTSVQLYVGVDIAAQTFSAAALTTETAVSKADDFPQTPEGFSRFSHWLLRHHAVADEVRIVMEATGTYWVALATALHHAGFSVCPVNPAHAHNFMKSLPRRAKTDHLDAQALALMARAQTPLVWNPPPDLYYQLAQRLSQRDSLLDLRQQVRNQLHALSVLPTVVPEVTARMHTLITTFDQQVTEIDAELEALASQESVWQSSLTLLQTIPGIGLVTACVVVVQTLNFSLCATAEAAVQYAGLALLAYESGTSVRGRPRIGHSGRGRLRTALYLASLSACRYNPPIRAFYQRLRAAGKPGKVARCAAARKLLHLAFAIVKHGCAFDPDYAHATSSSAA